MTVVAFQGEHGAYSEEAIRQQFGAEVDTLPSRTFEDIFASLDDDRSTLGVVPVENSLAGSINKAYDLLLEHDVHGCKYKLHGWSNDHRLYFGSNCSNDLWMYDPQKGETRRKIQRLPHNFEPVSLVKSYQSRPMGQSGLSVTRIVEESDSMDGQYEAFVIQDSFYGPFDVLVMRRSTPD